MNLATAAQLQGIPEQRTTRWHNPTKDVQRVVLHDGGGKPFQFVVPPGETRELDSRYDRAIHQVDCGRDSCHRRGWFCREGHDGVIIGGGAPLLRRVGAEDKLDPTLDPVAAERKEIVAELDRKAQREKLLREMSAERQGHVPAEPSTASEDNVFTTPAPPARGGGGASKSR